MNIFASDILFYVFGALAVILSLMVVFMRNPVSSAMMMALSFGATAAVMIGWAPTSWAFSRFWYTPEPSWCSSRSSSCC